MLLQYLDWIVVQYIHAGRTKDIVTAAPSIFSQLNAYRPVGPVRLMLLVSPFDRFVSQHKNVVCLRVSQWDFERLATRGSKTVAEPRRHYRTTTTATTTTTTVTIRNNPTSHRHGIGGSKHHSGTRQQKTTKSRIKQAGRQTDRLQHPKHSKIVCALAPQTNLCQKRGPTQTAR